MGVQGRVPGVVLGHALRNVIAHVMEVARQTVTHPVKVDVVSPAVVHVEGEIISNNFYRFSSILFFIL